MGRMPSVETHELFKLLKSLVSINSVNPDLVPGAKGEGEIAGFVAGWLREKGLEVHLEEAGKGRPNVIAVARGTGGGQALMLNAHLDTVGVAGMERPFEPALRDGSLYGRGALDTKGALAAFMLAAAAAAKAGLRGDVIFTAVVDEEYASLGTEAIAKKWKADGAIVGEPTGLALVVAHKGFAWFEIETCGVAAHGSLPETGVDAIVKMGKVLAGLEQMSNRLAAAKRHPLLGPGSMHASLITGGQEFSSYPARCTLCLERRTLPGENIGEIEAELGGMLEEIRAEDPEFKASIKTKLFRGPLEVARDEPIVQALAGQVAAVTGKEPEFKGMGGWMDSALLAEAGIPSVIFGPAGEGLHGVTEWVDLESVRQCYEITLATIKEFCG